MTHRRRLRRLLATLAGWVAIGTYLVIEWADLWPEELP